MELTSNPLQLRKDWLSKRPWMLLTACAFLILIVGIAIGNSWANRRAINSEVAEARGNFHWALGHVVRDSRPARTVETRPKECE